jgi:hypothetical protein
MLTQHVQSLDVGPHWARLLRLFFRAVKPVAPKTGAGRECTSPDHDREAGEKHQGEGHGIRRASGSTTAKHSTSADVAGWMRAPALKPENRTNGPRPGLQVLALAEYLP